LLGAFATGDDVFELIGEPGERCPVGRCVRVCGEPAGEVGFLLAQALEPVAVAANAFLAQGG